MQSQVRKQVSETLRQAAQALRGLAKTASVSAKGTVINIGKLRGLLNGHGTKSA